MDKSDCYYRRKYLMDTLNLPTLDEVKSRLGENLSKLFEERVPKNLKPEFGFSIKLGTGRYVWNSPSDLLIGKVCLKPPLTNKYLKALTHLSIFELGKIIEQKFWNEAELQKQKELSEQEELLRFLCEAEKKEVEKRIREEEQLKCEAAKRQMEIEFKEELLKQLEELEMKLLHEYELLMDAEKECLDERWEKLMQQEIEFTVNTLNAKWTAVLEQQKLDLYEEYNHKLQEENRKCRLALKVERECFTENFKHLKHQLQCKNIANIMYILCTERHRCQIERESLVKHYVDEIQSLQVEVTESKIKIQILEEYVNKKTQQLHIREQCLVELLQQFQKFINYVLRASPTQAEFLLTLENLICSQLKEEEEDDPSIQSSCKCYASTLNKHEDDKEPRYSLFREDFQNFISQDIKLHVSDMLVHQSERKHQTDGLASKSGTDRISLQSTSSKVHFKSKIHPTATQQSSKTSMDSKRPSIKSKTKYGSNIDYMALHELDHRFPLIGTKNSLELQKEELRSVIDKESINKVNEVLMVVKDSLIKHRNSLKTNPSPNPKSEEIEISSIPINKPSKKQYNLEAIKEEKSEPNSSEVLIKSSRISMHVDSLDLIQDKPENDQTRSKSFQISHIEAKIDKNKRLSTSVNFKLEPAVFAQTSGNETDVAETRENFVTKPNVVEVVGDREAKEHMQSEDDFACYRTQSLMRILKRHPSITRLFTSCGR